MLKKEDLIDLLAQKGWKKKYSRVLLTDLFDVITEALANDESVMIHGFGTFDTRIYAEKSLVDYQTKERVIIPPYKSPKFTPGKYLKRVVREGFIRK